MLRKHGPGGGGGPSGGGGGAGSTTSEGAAKEGITSRSWATSYGANWSSSHAARLRVVPEWGAGHLDMRMVPSGGLPVAW